MALFLRPPRRRGPGGGQPGQRPGPVLHHPGGALRPEPHFSGGFSPVRGSRPAPPGERDGGPAAGRRPTGGSSQRRPAGRVSRATRSCSPPPCCRNWRPSPAIRGTGGAAPPLGPSVSSSRWRTPELADADTPEALLALRQGESDTFEPSPNRRPACRFYGRPGVLHRQNQVYCSVRSFR